MTWRNTILVGDVREQLANLPDESVHCVVTSPPYWGLRDYGSPGQLGLEPTPEAYVESMVAVFRDVRRVLRSDGTLWLNLGDSYTSGGRKTRDPGQSTLHPAMESWEGGRADTPEGLKPKDLVGIPWRVAFALQADGWWLRSDIIWSKPNPMPESVTDRPTKSHEYLFLLTKSERYFYDAEAIKEGASYNTHARKARAKSDHKSMPDAIPNGIRPNKQDASAAAASPSTQRRQTGFNKRYFGTPGLGPKTSAADSGVRYNESFSAAVTDIVDSRNKRTVWEIATQPYAEAHFATYPQALVLPCIQAGTSEYGCCGVCGAPWRRVTEPIEEYAQLLGKSYHDHVNDLGLGQRGVPPAVGGSGYRTVGWEPTCKHEAPVYRCIVLDPFSGSATSALVALKAGRDFVGIELNSEYVEMGNRRLAPFLNRLL